jgi:hypothetical protein
MPNDRFTQLDQLRERLKAPSDLQEEVLWAIAERLEEAVSAPTRAPLETLDEQLIELFDAMPPRRRSAGPTTGSSKPFEARCMRLM